MVNILTNPWFSGHLFQGGFLALQRKFMCLIVKMFGNVKRLYIAEVIEGERLGFFSRKRGRLEAKLA